MTTLNVEATEMHANICQALADPKRILILYALAEMEQTGSDLSENFGIPQSTISRHLKILRERGLVVGYRDGMNKVYALTDRRVIDVLDTMRNLLADLLNQSASVMAGDEVPVP